MLKIRLSMGGAKKRPVYKIVVADSRFPRRWKIYRKVGPFLIHYCQRQKKKELI